MSLGLKTAEYLLLIVPLTGLEPARISELRPKRSVSTNSTKGAYFVDLPGFEPRQTESKSVVLPLHHRSL